jgi:hypothetical protein
VLHLFSFSLHQLAVFDSTGKAAVSLNVQLASNATCSSPSSTVFETFVAHAAAGVVGAMRGAVAGEEGIESEGVGGEVAGLSWGWEDEGEEDEMSKGCMLRCVGGWVEE